MLNIVKATDPVVVNTTTILLYGQPGSWKTTLAQMSFDPILLDFDQGIKRTKYRKSFVHINRWQDIDSMTDSDIAPFKTIIVDTLGACLEALTAKILDEDTKLGYCGVLNQRGWGILKARFKAWINMLRNKGKDIIILAHMKEDKEEDRRYFRPDAPGSAKEEIMKLADFIGYTIKQSDTEVILNYEGTRNYYGKNSANLKPERIPLFEDDPDYLGKKMTEMKLALGANASEHALITALIQNNQELVNNAINPSDLNSVLMNVSKSIEKDNSFKSKEKLIKMQIKNMADTKAKELNAFFDIAEKRYIIYPKPEPVIPQNSPQREEPVLAPAEIDYFGVQA